MSETFSTIPENVKNEIIKVTIQRYELEREDESMVHEYSRRDDLKTNKICNFTDRYDKYAKKPNDAEQCLLFLKRLRLTKRFFCDDERMLKILFEEYKKCIFCPK